MDDIFEAVKNNNLEDVKKLISSGTDVNCGRDNNWTPIMQAACIDGTYEIVKFLIDSGADLSVKDNYGVTILGLFAEYNEDPRIIHLLLEKGLDINARSNGGYTPLLLAASRNKSFKVIKTLIENGADLSVVTSDNKNAYQLARENYEEYKADFKIYPAKCNFLSSKICDYLKKESAHIMDTSEFINRGGNEAPDVGLIECNSTHLDFKYTEPLKSVNTDVPNSFDDKKKENEVLHSLKIGQSKTIYSDSSSKTVARKISDNCFDIKHYDFVRGNKKMKKLILKDETDETKPVILCIHGFGGSANNSTARAIRKLCPWANVIAEQFDLLDAKSVYKRIKEINPDILVGNSLGGFYTLTCKGSFKRIVVNPCLMPSLEIPKLDSSVSDKVIESWKAIEQKYEPNPDLRVFGVFAKDDELFHYKDKFDALFPSPSGSSLLVEGTHRLKNPGLTEGLTKAIEFLGGVTNEIQK